MVCVCVSEREKEWEGERERGSGYLYKLSILISLFTETICYQFNPFASSMPVPPILSVSAFIGPVRIQLSIFIKYTIITGVSSPLVCRDEYNGTYFEMESSRPHYQSHCYDQYGTTACIVAEMMHNMPMLHNNNIMRTLYLYLPRRSRARVLHEALSWPSLTLLLITYAGRNFNYRHI